VLSCLIGDVLLFLSLFFHSVIRSFFHSFSGFNMCWNVVRFRRMCIGCTTTFVIKPPWSIIISSEYTSTGK
jgi:hypothetical protein